MYSHSFAYTLLSYSVIFSFCTLLNCSQASAIDRDSCDEIVDTISRHYIEKKTKKKIIQESIQLYLNSLDKYSDYYNHPRLAVNETERSFGIGATLYKINNEYILKPEQGSKLEKLAGLGNYSLIAVDGNYVLGKSIYEVRNLIQGGNDTKVELTVIFPDRLKVDSVRITRKSYKNKNVSNKITNNYVLIKVNKFLKNTTKDKVRQILGDIEPGKDVVIDLRGSPGGDLHEAIDVASLFIESDRLIVSTVDNSGNKLKYYSIANQQRITKPIIILIDKYTASAAEVFAFALQYHKQATVIGQKSFGKCTSQSYFPLKNGDFVKLTNLKLLWANDIYCDGQGLTPDTIISNDKINNTDYLMSKTKAKL